MTHELKVDPLLAERTPEAAALQLAIVLAWLAECELATLQGLKLKRSTPKSEIRRHESICATMVYHCADLGITPIGLMGQRCPRLQQELLNQKQRLVERIKTVNAERNSQAK